MFSFGHSHFGGFGGFDDGVDRSSFASISSSALAVQDSAIEQFLDFLATVDTSDGFKKEKELKMHLVSGVLSSTLPSLSLSLPLLLALSLRLGNSTCGDCEADGCLHRWCFGRVKDARTALNRVVKEHKCKSTTRTLTRAEQDRVNKARKSLMKYTTLIVTPKAQIDYILSHLEVANKAREKAGLKRIGKQELEEKENVAPPAKASTASNGKKRTSEAADLVKEEEGEGSSSKKVKSEAT